jgi:two-component system LytT family response regulator
MIIKAIIIDDEPLSREGIRLRLGKYSSINVIAECTNGEEAVEYINRLKPDLIFLDISMPGKNGFEVLNEITMNPLPMTIFITAYDQFALKAFEYHAVDYLLKPIDDERFSKSINNTLAEFENRSVHEYVEKLKDLVKNVIGTDVSNEISEQKFPRKTYLNRIMIKQRDSIQIIPVDDVLFFESAGDYVYVHTETSKSLIRETQASLETKLDPSKFVRIHRSTIVNIEKVLRLKQNKYGDYDVFLIGDVRLKLTRTFKDHFQRMVEGLK